jgi:hypothetical protein
MSSPNTILDPRNGIRLYCFIILCVIFVVMQKIKIASVTSGVVLAMLVATTGIIVSAQIASASNVGGNGNPPIKTLKGGGTGPANGQGICYGQGAGLGTGNTQVAPGNGLGGGATAAHQQKVTRDTTCPANP